MKNSAITNKYNHFLSVINMNKIWKTENKNSYVNPNDNRYNSRDSGDFPFGYHADKSILLYDK
mgnify:CR=1 FL=1